MRSPTLSPTETMSKFRRSGVPPSSLEYGPTQDNLCSAWLLLQRWTKASTHRNRQKREKDYLSDRQDLLDQKDSFDFLESNHRIFSVLNHIETLNRIKGISKPKYSGKESE
jgi:hypothetical protein